MTNKPMLSVERELIERAVQAIINTSQMQPALNELRALLDKPVSTDFESWWAETGEQLTKHEIGLKDLMRCAYEAAPAAKRQGEPVISGYELGRIENMVADTDPVAESCASNEDVGALVAAVRTLQARELLRAEQPAPVAVVMPDRENENGIENEQIDRGYFDCERGGYVR